jgi:hypothetical protein
MDELFYNCHEDFKKNLKILSVPNISREFPYDLCENISDIITQYGQNLTHLSSEASDVFFDYMDLLESVLIVAKKRHLEIANIKDVLAHMETIYSKIYLSMVPCSHKNVSAIFPLLAALKTELQNRNLLPTLDEYDEEIAETVASMNDEERKNLTCALSLSN